MKRRSSCQSCRQRHRKCITRPNETRCTACDELDQECFVSSKFQFRSSKTAPGVERGRQGEAPRPSLSVLPENFGTFDHVVHGSGAKETTLLSLPQASPVAAIGTSSSSIDGTSPRQGIGTSPGLLRDIILAPTVDTIRDSLGPQQQSRCGPASLLSLESRDSVTRQSTGSSAFGLPEAHSTSGLTQREAFLLRIWIHKISLTVDAVDDARHFGVAVSRLALEHPVLLNGILAVASRFDALATDSGSDIESTYYHGRCIELLIDLLLRPAETYDGTLLAAVVISRLYEENDTGTDTPTYHLNGTRTLLGNDVISRLAMEGGLAEAACWVHLRQAIYIAIVHRQHLDIPLSVYRELTAFRTHDDTSYANRAVYLFARVLLDFFPGSADGSSPRSDTTWAFLERELESWFQSKPSSFNPIYSEPPDLEAGKPFPIIWMVSTVQTVALQYYYASKIVLCLNMSRHSSGNSGFEAARQRRNYEKSIASHLCTLMGLALSNRPALDACYLPCHMLDLCGYYIRSPTGRVHTIRFLEMVRQEIQWKTGRVISSLRSQWAELDDYGT